MAILEEQYIDFHTHRLTNEPGVFSLYNGIVGNVLDNQLIQSVGIHPWYVSDENKEEKKQIITSLAAESHVLAIGECGLDKVITTDLQLQTEVFKFQIELANQLKKPLIIHCVKAFQEVLHLLKTSNNQMPVIFHGFNKSPQLAENLTSQGYYLSFGAALFQERVQQALLSCPIQRIFFETDDKEFSVKELYTVASETLQCSVATLKSQICNNFQHIFKLSSTL